MDKKLATLANWWFGAWLVLCFTSALGAVYPAWMVVATSPISMGQQIYRLVNGK